LQRFNGQNSENQEHKNPRIQESKTPADYLIVKERGKKRMPLYPRRKCARAIRKWYPDHKRFFAISGYTAVSKNFCKNFYFWSKHHAHSAFDVEKNYQEFTAKLTKSAKVILSKEDIVD
jgi:hypothetical protein